MERTLIILKPDAVQRGVVGEILQRFERVGMRIVGAKMIQPTKDQLHHHYETIGQMVTRRGEDVFNMTLTYVMEGPMVAVVLEGVDAAEIGRKLVGATEPKSALPGTIRGDFSHMSFNHSDKIKSGLPNLIHASGDADEAKLEIAFWFSESELFEYETVHEKHTIKKQK